MMRSLQRRVLVQAHRQSCKHVSATASATRKTTSRATRSLVAHASAAAGLAPTPLAPGEVHLHWVLTADVLATPHLLDTYRRVLSPSELAHVDSSSSAAVRTERLLSRALARLTLARYCGQPPEALQLSSNSHGKPLLESARGLHFSVAHTQGALLCAVTLDGDVGVDIELRNRVDGKPSSSVERLAQRYFSADEHAELCALPDDASKRARFVELWTLKEAYVKALGRGIAAAPLAGFSMRVARASGSSLVGRIHLEHGVSSHFAPELYTRATHAGQQTELCGWHFWLLNLGGQTTEGDGGIGDDHVAAVCAPCIAPNRSPLLRCWRALPTVHERSVHLDPLAEGRTATACAAA